MCASDGRCRSGVSAMLADPPKHIGRFATEIKMLAKTTSFTAGALAEELCDVLRTVPPEQAMDVLKLRVQAYVVGGMT